MLRAMMTHLSSTGIDTDAGTHGIADINALGGLQLPVTCCECIRLAGKSAHLQGQ